MNRSTLTIILVAAALYYVIVLLFRGFLPPDYSPPVYFLVAPLVALVLVLLADLESRVTVPSETPTSKTEPRMVGREVQFLTKQIETATRASAGYYEHTLRARLREVLVDKVSLETGLEKERVKELLGNPRLGLGLLHDERLYALLYSKVPARGHDRVKMLQETVARVDGWKA